MNIIVCLDDKNGMLFNKRRQSADRQLRSQMLSFIGENTLWMNAYSASQFPSLPATAKVEEEYLCHAAEQDYCFVEDNCWEQYAADVNTIIVYRWNRVYPADTRFPAEQLTRRKLVSSTDFAGFSHDKLTQEVYSL